MDLLLVISVKQMLADTFSVKSALCVQGRKITHMKSRKRVKSP
nr:MAG TPA: Retro-transposon transporting motif [Bacteriophage sp.]